MDITVLAMRLGYVNLWEFYADWNALSSADREALTMEAAK